MKTQLVLYIVIGLLIVGLYVGVMHHYSVLDRIERDHRIENDSLRQVTDTQYRKLLDDRFSKKDLKKIIDSLGLEMIKNPNTVIVKEIQIREVSKPVDKLVYIDGKVEVEDFYPNKENPFIQYTLKDTTSNFKFYPFEMTMVVSENRDGTWQVDSKVPEFMKVSRIDAVAQPKKTERKRPFIVGAGYTRYSDKNSFEVSAGVKIKNIFITGSTNTEGGYGVKTFYNF